LRYGPVARSSPEITPFWSIGDPLIGICGTVAPSQPDLSRGS
jgi:hypothetical protein